MKLECPDCKSQVTAQGGGAVRCPKCGFTAKVPPQKPPKAPTPVPKPTPTVPPGPQSSQAPGQYTPPPPTNGFAIAALVTGILGFCQFFPAAVAAIVLGIIGMNQCRERNQPGESMALTGLILGGIGLAFTLVMFAGNFWMFY